MRPAPTIVLATALSGLVCIALASRAEDGGHDAATPAQHALSARYDSLAWNPIFPELGERSSQISILHVDPKSGATQLLVRIPKQFHLPLHWHSANETHTVIRGILILECEGRRAAFGPGSFNYMPARMNHEAWTSPVDSALVFITVDSTWDIHWVNGAPTPEDLLGAAWKKATKH